MPDASHGPQWDSTIACAYIAHRLNEEIVASPYHGIKAEIARNVGVSAQAISNVMTGTRSRIGAHVFDRFARYWSLSHDKLLSQAHAWAAKHPDVLEAAKAAAEPRSRLAAFTTDELVAELQRRAKIGKV